MHRLESLLKRRNEAKLEKGQASPPKLEKDQAVPPKLEKDQAIQPKLCRI